MRDAAELIEERLDHTINILRGGMTSESRSPRRGSRPPLPSGPSASPQRGAVRTPGHRLGNPRLDTDRVQTPGQVLEECQVRTGMAEGFRAEDNGLDALPDLKIETKVGGWGIAGGLGWHHASMSPLWDRQHLFVGSSPGGPRSTWK